MESKRTLWIVAAAGIFLLVVVGLAVILYNPSLQQQKNPAQKAYHDANSGWLVTQAPESATLEPPVNEVDFSPIAESENIFDAGENPFANSSIQTQVVQQISDQPQNPNEFSPLHTENVTVIADNTTIISHDTTTIDLNALKNPKTSVSSNVTPQNELTETQITNAKQNQAAQVQQPVPVQITQNFEIKQEPVKIEQTKEVVSVKPAVKKEVASVKTAPAKKAEPKVEAKKAVAAPAKTTSPKVTAPKSQDKFWVQVAAYSNIDNAKAARSELESNRIQCDIFTITSNGKDMYRVQSGPYTTRYEAEHWGEQIAKIDRFANTKSMIIKNN